jgi:hypothetical protein
MVTITTPPKQAVAVVFSLCASGVVGALISDLADSDSVFGSDFC